MMITRRAMTGGAAITAAVAAITFAQPHAASAQGADFSGRTVEVMVNFAAGGGVDQTARLIAGYIADHLPGNPSLIVTNRAGASGMAAVEHLMSSVAPDGLTIGYFAGPLLTWAIGVNPVPPGMEDLPVVVGRSVNHVVLASTSSGLNVDTFPGHTGRVFLAVNAPDNAMSIRMRLFADAVGVPGLEVISGYDTQPRMHAAVRAGEADMAPANESAFGIARESLLGDGVLMAFGQLGEFTENGIVAQAGLDDIPVLDEVWRRVAPDTLGSPAHRAWEAYTAAHSVHHYFVLPMNTPQPIIDAWEAAILAAHEDPRYIEQMRSLGMPLPNPVRSAEMRQRLETVRPIFADPEVTAVIEAAIARNLR
mgnify:CR=1 FL=1